MQGPTSSDAVRQAASGGGLTGPKTTVVVSRSFSAVTASLGTGASKCLNRTQTTRPVTARAYGPIGQTITTQYRTSVKTSGSKTEMAMYQEVLGRSALPQPKGFSYVVDAVPASSGTQLTFYGGRFGYGNLNRAVEQWARGGAITCPKLPGA